MNGKVVARKGVLYCVLYYRDEKGDYKQKWISTGLKERGNMKEAKKILDDKLVEYSSLDFEDIIKPHKQKETNDILWLDWLKDYINERIIDISPTQAHIYQTTFINIFTNYWGSKELYLSDVKAKDITDFYSYLRKTRKIKEITIKRYACVLRPALKKAFLAHLIKENPYDYVPSLKREKASHVFYDQNDMEKLFKAIRGDVLELPIKFLAYYGLRRSELLGITWQAIDFDNKTISINHKVIVVKKKVHFTDKMKTETSNRTLPLIPAMEKELKKQMAQIERDRAYFGEAYSDEYKDFVFVDNLGKLLLPDHITHGFNKILKRHKLKKIRLHDLRHSCASIMLANGVQMKQIQEWLGHSNFSTTADVYSHLDYSSKIESAKKIANALNGKKSTPKEDESISLLSEIETRAKALGFSSIQDLLEKLKNIT